MGRPMNTARDGKVVETTNPQELDNQNYSVGWICAFKTEYVAAQQFLDEEHRGRPLYMPEHDKNEYTLGRMERHNVVIATSRDGQYGATSAHSVAHGMRQSFPNLLWILVVGIAGGAPSDKHDIRLGDVIVSDPQDGRGVLQYDYGKAVQDHVFHHTGSLEPPKRLLDVVYHVKALYEADGNPISKAIELIINKRQWLSGEYSQPSSNTDCLYESEHIHPPGGGASYEYVLSNEALALRKRQARGDDDDNPAIHYGLIASGDQLVKDAVLRDWLSQEQNILCFDMGLGTDIPYLVIRGICDYSDIHRNDQWQCYAAMTAAAYAKVLLRRVIPVKVETEEG
ncbi:nucleoside phosphorylase domain-containing protein [Microdochium trichocladiopsis]|uniref:Nucleoside phosphorylase domain-containing protein n=1 Tax=Microdochium trichocladiopsis TaxID=1682393 RepID=A0A9P8XQH0_9PEZI|nr:nucleoside phosphorylase domain-containing protein [Microdochium trichocladiopsis]KAH7012111.1 nucleoside phosphorylase domain-containing protein [Microdochium trichocladiopsis]